MPMNTNFSPAGQALFGGIPGLTAVAGLGVQLESDEERKRRLAQLALSRGQLTQSASPASASLFGSPLGAMNGGLVR
jgi:hypothetical protein